MEKQAKPYALERFQQWGQRYAKFQPYVNGLFGILLVIEARWHWHDGQKGWAWFGGIVGSLMIIVSIITVIRNKQKGI